MKNLFTYSWLFLALFISSNLLAQKGKQEQKPFDHKIDAMWYWEKAAEKGIIPYNPKIPFKAAINKGSQLDLPNGSKADSPDVPVYSGNDATESEVSIFIDPNDNMSILNSNNSTTWNGSSVGSVLGANYFLSSDGGFNWGGSIYGAGGNNSGDPAALIGLTGRRYVGYIAPDGGQGVAYSTDGGSSWTHVQTAPGPGGSGLLDKNHLWIDNSTTSPYAGNLYNAWTTFNSSSPNNYQVEISRSTNGGLSWSSTTNISSGTGSEFDHGVNLQTGPNGEVYAVWAIYTNTGSDLNEDGIGFAKSTNGGASWQSPSIIISNIKGVRDDGVSKDMRTNSFPVMAVDISNGANSGNIYVVWANRGIPGTNSGTNISVYMIRSTDGGSNWSTPVRVNQGTYANGKEAYLPWITCDPITGVLSTIFYDDRNTASTDCETFVSNSFDGGLTWTDMKVSDVSFTPSAIPGLAGGYFGDYLGIAARGGMVYPVWTDNRSGGAMAYVSPFSLGLNASFTADVTEICVGSGVQFTDLSTGPPTSWTWDFPGGSPVSYVGQNPPVVTYASPGTYDVSLTVYDASNNASETKTDYITVKNVIADFDASIYTVVEGNTIDFTDNSSCSPTTWAWTFNGGSPATFNGQNPPSISFATEGIYDITLTVTNASGTDTKTKQIEVVPPTFNMTNGTVTSCVGHFYDSGGAGASYSNNENYTMTFYPASAGAKVRMEFLSFDVESQSTCNYDELSIYDGEDATATLLGAYCGTTNPGTFTATNGAGALTFVFTSDGSVTNAGWNALISCYSTTNPPVADFSASTTSTLVDGIINFTDLSTNTPNSWTWTVSPATYTFENGTNANTQNPQIKFLALGDYTISLSATNAYGTDTETKTDYITVIAPGSFPFIDDFETDLGWTLTGEFERGMPQGLGGEHGNPDPGSAYSGSNVLGVDLSGLNTQLGDYEQYLTDREYQAISPVINCAGHMNIELSFQQWLNVESPTYDHAYIDISNDGGNTWNEIWTNSALMTENTWSHQTINIAAYADNQPTVQIRFSLGSTDVSWFYSGWNIDDFTLDGTTLLAPIADFSADNLIPVISEAVNFTDASTNIPTSWAWTFSPNTVTFESGTSSTDQNPIVSFDAAGQYTVTLTASNSIGGDDEQKVNYIHVLANSYCDASGGGDEYISGVQMGTIDNTGTGSDGYMDYTALSTDLSIGQTYDITVTNGNVWNDDDLGVWIDWNQDGDYYDTDENVVCEVNNGGEGTFSFTVPAAALSGQTRMRIRIKWSGDDCGDPCGTTSYGEVEDYSVNILGGSSDFDLSLTEFLEGSFNGTNMDAFLAAEMPLTQPFNGAPWNYSGTESVSSIPANVVDWVLIELRDAATPDAAGSATMFDRKAAFITTNGQIVDLDGTSNLHFSNGATQNLYIVIWHMNHIGVMSANAPTNVGGVQTYNFTSGETQAYGGAAAHKEIATGVWGMVGGDSDHNGVINEADLTNVWNYQSGTRSYKTADFNLNTEVNNIDKNDIWEPNAGESSQIPANPSKGTTTKQVFPSMVKCQIPK